jgi:hypothetical protein
MGCGPSSQTNTVEAGKPGAGGAPTSGPKQGGNNNGAASSPKTAVTTPGTVTPKSPTSTTANPVADKGQVTTVNASANSNGTGSNAANGKTLTSATGSAGGSNRSLNSNSTGTSINPATDSLSASKRGFRSLAAVVLLAKLASMETVEQKQECCAVVIQKAYRKYVTTKEAKAELTWQIFYNLDAAEEKELLHLAGFMQILVSSRICDTCFVHECVCLLWLYVYVCAFVCWNTVCFFCACLLVETLTA